MAKTRKKVEKKKELEKKLSDAQNEISLYKDKWLRAKAELLNYQKKVEERKNEEVEVEKEKLLLKFLNIFQFLEQALKETSSKGLELLVKNFKKILKEEGVQEIKTIGERFDHRFHHVIGKGKSKKKAGIIIEEVRKGWKKNDKILKPAMVIVSEKNKNFCNEKVKNEYENNRY